MRQGAAEEAGAKVSEHVLAEAEVCLETVGDRQADVARSRAAAG